VTLADVLSEPGDDDIEQAVQWMIIAVVTHRMDFDSLVA